MKDKFILDACCGNRQFWFNKHHPNTFYIDNRLEEKGFQSARPNKEIKPDLVMDFREMNLMSGQFKLVVFDPPHIIAKGPDARMTKEYGWLNKETWKFDITKGFNECWRVLEDYGILIFKWSETSIKIKDVLKVIPITPLFGHPSGSKSKTKWFVL